MCERHPLFRVRRWAASSFGLRLCQPRRAGNGVRDFRKQACETFFGNREAPVGALCTSPRNRRATDPKQSARFSDRRFQPGRFDVGLGSSCTPSCKMLPALSNYQRGLGAGCCAGIPQICGIAERVQRADRLLPLPVNAIRSLCRPDVSHRHRPSDRIPGRPCGTRSSQRWRNRYGPASEISWKER